MQNLWITPEELPSEYASSSFGFEACASASLILWGLSGRKYTGSVTVTETYDCPARSSGRAGSYALFTPDARVGVDSVPACGCSGAVAGQHPRLRLRGTPVQEVHSVSRGTTELPADTYTVVNRTTLQAPGSGCLDTCGLTVTYTYGTRPPTLGRRAAAELAVEFIKDWDPEQGDCRLPDRVSSVSRQGVSYTILDDQSYLNDLRTGLYSIDLFLRTTNPYKAVRRARVFSPDIPRVSRRTGTGVRQPLGPNDMVLEGTGSTVWIRRLDEINGAPFFAEEAWRPIVQIIGSHGATVLDVPDDQVTVDLTLGTIQVELSAADALPISDVATMNIYAEGAGSLAHVLTASVRPESTVGV